MIRIDTSSNSKMRSGRLPHRSPKEFNRDGQGRAIRSFQKARRLRSSKELQVTRHGRCKHDHPSRTRVGSGRGWERI